HRLRAERGPPGAGRHRRGRPWGQRPRHRGEHRAGVPGRGCVLLMAEERSRSRRAEVGKVLRSASTDTINLVVAGSAAVGAAALSSWAVAALGGLTYAALVAWDVASPKYWKKVLARKPPPPSLPPADQLPTT